MKPFSRLGFTKYKKRVICKNLLELIQIFNANATSYKKLETPVMNFVVGSYSTEVDAPKIETKDEEQIINTKKTHQIRCVFYWRRRRDSNPRYGLPILLP